MTKSRKSLMQAKTAPAARAIPRRARRPDGCRIRAVQHMEALRGERLGKYVGDETRAAHPAHEGARQSVSANGGRERDVVVPLHERFLRRAHPSELIHWRANIMRNNLGAESHKTAAKTAT